MKITYLGGGAAMMTRALQEADRHLGPCHPAVEAAARSLLEEDLMRLCVDLLKLKDADAHVCASALGVLAMTVCRIDGWLDHEPPADVVRLAVARREILR